MKSNEIDNTARYDLIRQKTPIAVIGIAGLFPDSKDIEEYWDNIINEVDTIKDVPASRWKIEDYYDPDPSAPDKTYSKRGGFIPDVDFNPMDFGLPPNILEVTDVSQLLALVVARQVLEDAGYGEESGYNRENIGITLGVGGGQKLITPLTTRLQYPIWKRVLTNSGISEEDSDEIIEKIKKAYIGWEENSFPGMLGNVIAGRVANRLNLGGTNCVLDAACASSLTAMNMAISDLLEYRSEIMITGGIDTDNSPFMYLSFSKTPAFTPDDTIRPFDIDSRGMLIGEGIGMVALKRLEDAERDKDRMYAVIKGIGTSSDGRFKSIYAPRPEGQVKALEQAYAKAGFPPQTVGLVEAHGTGTAAGDIAEFTALKTVFESDNNRKQYIALGSVKSQIGHTKAAAGSAGFIKAALALYHRILPATINVNQPLPKMDIENSPFFINSETRPWFPSPNGYPRRAAVSSFGFGGTNFHAVLEEYTRNKDRLRKHNTLHSVVISDSTPEALLKKCRTIHKDLISDNGNQAFFNLVTQNGISKIPASDARLGFICGSLSEAVNVADLAVKGLESQSEEAWEKPEGLYYRPQGFNTRGKVVALFPGQGSQYLNMGSQLAINFPAVMDSFVRMDRLFAEDGRSILTETVFPIPVFSKTQKAAGNQALQKTEVAQPAIAALSAGMYTIFKDAGFIPDYTAGHSFGELTALYVSGVLSAEDFYFLAKERGKAMAAPGDADFDSGAMLAVIGDIETLWEDIKAFSDIVIANLNSGRQAVVAGPKKEIKTAESDLKARGYSVIPLQVSAAFHTPLVEHARKPFAKALESVRFNRPEIAIFSNSTGGSYPKDPEKIREILENHILNPVLFKDEIENIYQAGGRIFIEFGPKNVLTKLVGDILSNRPHTAIALNTGKGCSDIELRRAAVKMCVAGLDISEIDPCRKMMAAPSDKKSGLMNITLNGSNYVSEKTRKTFEDSLNDGFKVRQAEPEVATQTIPTPIENRSESAPEAADRKGAPHAPLTHQLNPFENGESVMEKRSRVPMASETRTGSIDSIEKNIEQFFKHQDETLKVHSQYLSGIREYTGLFYDLMRQQHDLLREQPGLKFPQGIEGSMEMFHTHQGETLKVHAQYLNNQTVCAREALGLIKQKVTGEPSAGLPHEVEKEPVAAPIFTSEGIKKARETHDAVPAPTPVMPERVEAAPAPVMPEKVEAAPTPVEKHIAAPAPPPCAASTAPSANIETLKTAMLEIVSEKTGYPSEMLELDMDMEADLGIDSIKRVEILAGFTEQFPDLPEANPEELAELKTLGEVIDKYRMLAQPAAETPAAPCRPETKSDMPCIHKLTRDMLDVVSEKTGYPSEMLELDMDMEADLGIDSIKRVEILAGIQERFPQLPEVPGDELAGLKTLREVAERMAAAGDSGPATPAQEKTVAAQVVTNGAKRSIAVVKKLPAPDVLEFNVKEDEVCLITDDGTQMTSLLSEALVKRGFNVVVVSYPEAMVKRRPKLSEGIARVILEDMSEESLESVIAHILKRFANIGGFIHLDPPVSKKSRESVIFPEKEKDILLWVFLAAKHLKKHLTDGATAGRRFFMTACRLDGKLGISGKGFGLVSGGLCGLTKTLNLEWGNVFARIVDLGPDKTPADSASIIINELFDPDCRIVETAYGPEGRVTLEALEAEGAYEEKNDQIDSSSVFLVAGGAKGVTAACVAELSAAHKCRFILLGRSEYQGGNEPDWATGINDPAELKKAIMNQLKQSGETPTPKVVEKKFQSILSNRDISRTLSRIRETGSPAEYISADVTDRGTLKKKLAPVVEKLGPVTGIIHGAGVLADRRIEDKTVNDFEAVYSTKVKGLEALLDCVETDRLTYLSLFSSAAGFFGNEGQSDYAIANEILNKSAYRFKTMYPACHVSAFNWGPWDGGMVTPELKRMFAEKNIDVIPVKAGSQLFADELSSSDNTIQILVGSSMRPEQQLGRNGLGSFRITRRLVVDDNPFLKDHVIGENPVLPTVCAASWMAEACEMLYPGFSFFSATGYKMFKGIVFDGTQAQQYILDIDEVEKNPSHIEFNVNISSRKKNGEPINHYAAGIRLVSRLPEPPVYEKADFEVTKIIDGGRLYRDGTLFHGPNFQGIERVINLNDNGLTVECRLPEVAERDQGQFRVGTFNPYAADVQFQCMLVWVRHYLDAASLPAEAQAAEHYVPVPAGRKFYVSLAVKNNGSASMTADITSHDRDGRVYSRITEAKVIISKQLDRLFSKAGKR